MEQIKGDAKIVESKAKCPKCRSKDLTLQEITEAFVEWQQRNGEFDYNSGAKDFGNIKGVFAVCDKCNHNWKLRITQITDVLNAPLFPQY